MARVSLKSTSISPRNSGVPMVSLPPTILNSSISNRWRLPYRVLLLCSVSHEQIFLAKEVAVEYTMDYKNEMVTGSNTVWKSKKRIRLTFQMVFIIGFKCRFVAFSWQFALTASKKIHCIVHTVLSKSFYHFAAFVYRAPFKFLH